MSTSIEIWNSAMLRIGADRITAFGIDEESQLEAALAATNYQNIKESFLRSYAWNPALRRAVLAESTESPPNQFGHRFALPSDCLRLIEARSGDRALSNINGQGVRTYELEGRFILTNETNIIAKYVSNIDESEFGSQMEEALIGKICAENVFAIGQSNTALSNFAAMYEAKLNEAKTTDALENPHVVFRTDSLRVVRR